MDRTLSLMERRRQGARDEIVAIALELIDRDGFDATTVDAIAAAAGCSPRTFYRYFGSKEDVMFHDLPEVIAGFGQTLESMLGAGLDEWSALSESMVGFIDRFDVTDQRTATRRMDLWSHEPALRARYLQYVAQAETTAVEILCRHRATSPDEDDTAQLMAVAAVGAYRVTVTTHRARATGKLTDHLRESLAAFAIGLAKLR